MKLADGADQKIYTGFIFLCLITHKRSLYYAKNRLDASGLSTLANFVFKISAEGFFKVIYNIVV